MFCSHGYYSDSLAHRQQLEIIWITVLDSKEDI
jgi:hypothetical protein